MQSHTCATVAKTQLKMVQKDTVVYKTKRVITLAADASAVQTTVVASAVYELMV